MRTRWRNREDLDLLWDVDVLRREPVDALTPPRVRRVDMRPPRSSDGSAAEAGDGRGCGPRRRWAGEGAIVIWGGMFDGRGNPVAPLRDALLRCMRTRPDDGAMAGSRSSSQVVEQRRPVSHGVVLSGCGHREAASRRSRSRSILPSRSSISWPSATGMYLAPRTRRPRASVSSMIPTPRDGADADALGRPSLATEEKGTGGGDALAEI